MNYTEWLTTVPTEITGDPLWRMEVYRLALFVSDIAWPDACRLMRNHSTIGLSDQLYRATGSISANIVEGYSRQSGKDQARFYEYALGSAREARTWNYQGRHVLTEGGGPPPYQIAHLYHSTAHDDHSERARLQISGITRAL